MNKFKLEKGITLVALVITIIVLLILAVVAIGAVRDSGIIGHAQNSADRYNTGKLEEESMLGQYEDAISQYEKGGSFGTSGDGSGNIIEDEDIVVDEPTLPVLYGKAVNTNMDDFAEALSLEGYETFHNKDYGIVYRIENTDSILSVSVVSGNSFQNYAVIYVFYRDELGNSSSYAICSSENAWSLEELKGSATAYDYIPADVWSKPSGEKYTNVFGDDSAEIWEPVSEIPEFIGNWRIDENSSSQEGIRLLSQVLVDLYEE